MFYNGNWIDSFPQNYQWSNATSITKGMAPWGAVALGEIDVVIQRLHERDKEPSAWWEEWSALGERLKEAADRAAAAGHQATAGNCYIRAGMYYYTAERMLPPGEEKWRLYRLSLHCNQEGLKRRYPNIEFVEVPYENGTTLPAYFIRSSSARGRVPTVVMFDGLDNCKEMSVLFAGLELAHRGYHMLAIDGPGQGESVRLRNMPSRYDYEVPGTAAYDYVASRPDVDPARVAIAAYSLGGYSAPRMAAFEPRYKACVAWGAIFDYHAMWAKRRKAMEANGSSVATSHFQLPWVMGVKDMDAAMEKIRKFNLSGVAERIRCPTLILFGENDRLTTVDVARQLYDAVGAADKTLKLFTAEEGGAEHCQADNRQLGIDYIGDWLSTRL